MTARVTDGIRRACGIVEGMRDNEFAEATVCKAAVAEACDRLDEAVEAVRQDMWDEGFEAGRERSIEDREAIAWVREHGGLDEVREEWKLRSNLKRMCEKEKAKVERQQRHIEFVQGKCRERQEHICELNKLKRAYVDALNGVCKRLGLTDGTGLPDMPEVIWAELDRRLVPEGMEWPRHESGERVKRPSVLAADGEPLLKYETVYEIKTGERYFVTNVFDGMTEPDFPEHTVECRKYEDVVTHMFRPDQLTHQRPVPDADGVPIREADRRAMADGLDVIRVACVQPVGTSTASRVPGAVSSAEYERAKMMVVMGAMQLWASGKLDLVGVDPS